MEGKPIKLKQYVILPKRPKMSTGKLCSQTAHAVYMSLKQTPEKLKKEWEQTGQCVIVLEAKDQLHLMQIAEYCKQWGISGWLYYDEGFTEVDPLVPTAFATGVLTEEHSIFFSQFKLYGKKWWE